MWDARWYQIVWLAGYPADPPLTGALRAENAWAFLPAYPALVGVLTWLAIPWNVASVVVAVAADWRRAGLPPAHVEIPRARPGTLRGRALLRGPGVADHAVRPGGVARIPLAGARAPAARRTPVRMALPGDPRLVVHEARALAFALAVALHWAWRWFHRRRDLFPVRERVLAASVAVFSGLAGISWVGIARVGTGDLHAYTDTELAWRSAYIGYHEPVPFTAWFQSGTGGSASRSAPSR